MCDLEDIILSEEWTVVSVNFHSSFRITITLDRACIKTSPVALISEAHTLISENSTELDIIIYTDGLAIRNLHIAWTFTAQCEGNMIREECGTFAITTSSMAMAVTKAKEWLKTE